MQPPADRSDMDCEPAIYLPPERLPLLITGVAGVAGFNALHYFQARYPGQVIGLRQRDNWRLAGPGIVACDAEDRLGLRGLFRQHRFRSVLNCAGNCALKSCELAPQMAWRINVEGARNLVEAAAESSARLVHLSIDLVFSGTGSGGYREHMPTDPVTVYGTTMVAGEELVQTHLPAACILRISLPMGVSFNGHAGAIDWIQSRFKKGRPATLYFDEVRTPTYVDCMNRMFEQLLASDVAGLFHAGGPRRLSLYQIAQIVNRIGGYDPRLLIGIPRRDAGPMPPRAGNVALDSSRLTELLGSDALHPWPLDDACVPSGIDWHFARPRLERGSPGWLSEVLYRNPRRAQYPVPLQLCG